MYLVYLVFCKFPLLAETSKINDELPEPEVISETTPLLQESTQPCTESSLLTPSIETTEVEPDELKTSKNVWSTYISHPIFLPSFAISLLYL
jgi:hypothetical protein